MTSPLEKILGAAIDYAGLFPPVNVDMATAMRSYIGYLAGPRAWALGRFVVPVARFEEFNFHVGELEAEGRKGRLRLSALVGDDVEASFDKIARFNRWHAQRDGTLKPVVETVEVKAAFSEAVLRISECARDSSGCFFEIPIERDAGSLVSAIARAGAAAKVRTGGAAPGMRPSAESLAGFLDACLRAGVRFKATGGLRYPVSGLRALTPDPKASKEMTYGFLNLLFCAAFLYDGASSDEAVAILEEGSAAAFTFGEDGVAWRGKRVGIEALAGFRRDFAVSFGSASFDEPMDRLGELDLS